MMLTTLSVSVTIKTNFSPICYVRTSVDLRYPSDSPAGHGSRSPGLQPHTTCRESYEPSVRTHPFAAISSTAASASVVRSS